jgi:hypothetical protein
MALGDFNSAFPGDAPPDPEALASLPLTHRRRHVDAEGNWLVAPAQAFIDAGFRDAGAGDPAPTAGFGPTDVPKRPDGAFLSGPLAAGLVSYRRIDVASDHQGIVIEIDLGTVRAVMEDIAVLRRAPVARAAEAAAERLRDAGLDDKAAQLLAARRRLRA